MNLLKFIFFGASFFFSTNLLAQELQWLNIFEKDYALSKIWSIDQTSNGDYLVFAFQTSDSFKGQTYILKYNTNGEILTEDSLDIDPYFYFLGLSLQELPDSTYLLVLKNGEVYQMNLLSDSPELLFTIETRRTTSRFELWENLERQVNIGWQRSRN